MPAVSARAASALRAAAHAGAFGVVYLVFVCTETGQGVDAATLGAFPLLQGEGWMRVYGIRDVLPVVLMVLVAILAVVSIVCRRIWAVVAASALVMGVFGLARLFDALPRPQFGAFGYPQNTFPSGHVAVCLACAVAIGWLAPAAGRRMLAAVAFGITLIVAAASLLSLAHRGSDVVGGALLTGAAAGAVSTFGGLPADPLPAQEPLRRRLGLAIVVAAGCAALGIVVGPEVRAPLAGAASLVAVTAIAGVVVLDSQCSPVPGLLRGGHGARRSAG
ncbi:phosphatase PAP2 family protein [Microbacterium xylanilyticum]